MVNGVGNEIIFGATGGAIAGLVVSIALGAYRLIVTRIRRRDQIRHIREMIVNDREHIYGEFEEGSMPPDPHRPSPNLFRWAIFGGMRRELELALDGRSSEITFDEIRQVRRIFIRDDLIRERAPDKSPDGLRHYDQIFGELEEVEWLKLPKRRG